MINKLYIQLKYLLAITTMTFFMALENSYDFESFWLNVLIGVPKWISIFIFMDFRDWVQSKGFEKVD